ncbi:hypothetical protein DL96DRAFT_1463103 [Flagelloscypha sp. PMI_526]|nr:hypothetical protein DL96DRAFT_1463103 [Flagelloscypha sp. PMI_526]
MPVPDPDVIPSVHPFRTLIICFDGTGDEFDDDNSNVCELFTMLKKSNPEQQVVYYQASSPGIGTYNPHQFFTSLANWFSNTLDSMWAQNLDDHIMRGYEFLMQNYRAGDRICIFGFSRGAYTARCLAGMIREVGVLPAFNYEQVPFAYKVYAQNDEAKAEKFKASFSLDVDIEMVGVWDTVASVGFIPKYLPFTTSNKIIKTFRHAIALDECRAKFKTNLWHHHPKDKKYREGEENDDEDLFPEDEHPDHAQAPPQRKDTTSQQDPTNQTFFTEEDIREMEPWKRPYISPRKKDTDVQEVWFAGAHCDVGGGSVQNGTRYSLARIPLRWMIRQCFKTNSGIMFSKKGLLALGFDLDSLYDEKTLRYPIGKGRSNSSSEPESGVPRVIRARGTDLLPCSQDPAAYLPLRSPIESEELEEYNDALSPEYDQLTLSPKWWILEYLPLRTGIGRGAKRQFNRGNGREITQKKIKIHRSVRVRLGAALPVEEMGWCSWLGSWLCCFGRKQRTTYEPRADLDWSKVKWVD